MNHLRRSLNQIGAATRGVALCCAIGLPQPVFAQRDESNSSTFTGLGDLPGRQFLSMALAISGDGRVVVGYSHSQAGTEAFRWREGVMESLGGFPGETVFTIAHAVSHDGSIIVGSGTFRGRTQSFIFDGKLKPLLEQSGIPPISEAWGISADGSIITGQQQRGTTWDAFIWNRGVASIIAAPKDVTSMIGQAVSRDGTQIAGTLESARGAQAFVFALNANADGVLELGDLPGSAFGSAARAISADGSVVVGSGTSSWGIEAFRWRAGAGMSGLGGLSDHHELTSYPHAISADGSIIVGTSESEDGRDEAFIWDPRNGMRSLRDVLTQEYGLDLSGWWLTDATGISDDGRTITGYGKNPQKFTEGWVAHLSAASKTQADPDSPSTPALDVARPALNSLAEPSSAAIAPNGAIYIAESAADRIAVFDASGDRQRTIEKSAERSWFRPQAIAVAADGTTYVLGDDGGVFALDAADRVLASWGPGTLNHPRGMAATAQRVYVADTLNDRIAVFGRDGGLLASWGSAGQERGQFHQPGGITVDASNNVYVADSGNHRIQKFDAEGKWIAGWGDRGNAAGFFIHPAGLACINDRLYVADSGNHRIQVFDLNGGLQYVWGARALHPRDANGRLMYPSDVAIAARGEFGVICEPMQNRCQIVSCIPGADRGDSGGRRLPPAAPPRPFIGPALDVAGHFAAVIQTDRDSIDILDVSALEPAPRVIATVGEYGSKFGQLLQPTCVKIDLPRSRILVGDAGNHRLQVFEFNPEWTGNVLVPPAAKFLRSIDLRSVRASMPSSPMSFDIVPVDIEVAADGSVLMLDRANNRVVILDPHYAPIRSIGVPTGAVDMTLSRDGQAVYALDQTGCEIRALNLSGERLFSWGKPGTNAGEFYNPSGMTAGPDGFVYVTDGLDRIQKFDERGVFVSQWGRPGVGAREFFKPRGIAHDDQARLFIADWGNHRVQVFGSQGEYRGTFGAALYIRPAKHEQD